MAVMHHGKVTRLLYAKYNLSGGAKLDVPKTPVEKIVLNAKLMKLKADYLRRHPEHGS